MHLSLSLCHCELFYIYMCTYVDVNLHMLLYNIQVQSWLQVSNNIGILNTCTWLWQMELEQATLVDSMKDVVRSSVKVPEFDKHLKKTRGHIGRNVVEIAIKMKRVVRKPLMIKIIKLHLRNGNWHVLQGNQYCYWFWYTSCRSRWHKMASVLPNTEKYTHWVLHTETRRLTYNHRNKQTSTQSNRYTHNAKQCRYFRKPVLCILNSFWSLLFFRLEVMVLIWCVFLNSISTFMDYLMPKLSL